MGTLLKEQMLTDVQAHEMATTQVAEAEKKEKYAQTYDRKQGDGGEDGHRMSWAQNHKKKSRVDMVRWRAQGLRKTK